MIHDPAFLPAIRHLDLNKLDASPDIIYIVDAALVLRAYNAAYEKAAQSAGAPDVLTRFALGTHLLNALRPPADDFYVSAYTGALETGAIFQQDYECNTPGELRLFHQTAYPLPDRAGLLISHHLVTSSPAGAGAVARESAYRNPDGMIIQCACCRKVRDATMPARWDWVPLWVHQPAANTSHTWCPRCREHYYPDPPARG